MPPVVFVSPERTVGTWSSKWPAAALAARGHEVVYLGQDGTRQAFLPPRAVVVVHCSNNAAGLPEMVAQIRHQVDPTLLVLQWDDSYWDLGDIQRLGDWWDLLIEETVKGAKMADRVLVRTPRIAGHFRAAGVDDVRVVPAYIAEWVTTLPLTPTGPLAVWLGGVNELHDPDHPDYGSAHAHDWRWYQASGPRPLPLRIVGASPRDARFYRREGVSVSQLVLGTLDQEKLYRQVAWGAGVGIVPLAPSGFNEAKSWIKGLEFAALGIETVATPTESYRALRSALPAGTVHMAADGREMADKAATVLSILRPRNEALRTHVRRHLTVEANVHQWEAALDLPVREEIHA